MWTNLCCALNNCFHDSCWLVKRQLKLRSYGRIYWKHQFFRYSYNTVLLILDCSCIWSTYSSAFTYQLFHRMFFVSLHNWKLIVTFYFDYIYTLMFLFMLSLGFRCESLTCGVPEPQTFGLALRRRGHTWHYQVFIVFCCERGTD